jgi:hypothetical protein
MCIDRTKSRIAQRIQIRILAFAVDFASRQTDAGCVQFARSEGSAMRLCISMTAAIVAGAGLLSACTTNTAQEDARREYERSVADYENCVAANQMSTCERERRIMKANKRALSAATQGSRR